MDFEVTIDNFSGPLDLMLHLIKENQLDLFNLDIEVLTDQYINFIHAMEKLRLDVASEYLTQLAVLLEFKSKRLLKQNDTEEIEDDYSESEQDLVDRLIEYQKYKEVVSDFQRLYDERKQQYEKPQSQIVNQWESDSGIYSNASAYDLIKAMNKCLQRYKLASPYEVNITKKSLTVDQRKIILKDLIESFNEVFTMYDTLNDCKDVYEVVVNFLAILDLVNDNYLSFTVKDEDVYFKKVIV